MKIFIKWACFRTCWTILGVFGYDYNLLQVEWKPTQCLFYSCVPGYLEADFNIHGYWPSNFEGPSPEHCISFSYSMSLTTQAWAHKYWVSHKGNEEKFWKHEWNKHGKCVHPLVTCDDYFTTVLNLYHKLTIQKSLAHKSIAPSNTKLYQLGDFAKAFMHAVRISCIKNADKYYLNIIGFCYDTSHNWISCRPYKSNCGSGFILHT
jgi:ribonuclease I